MATTGLPRPETPPARLMSARWVLGFSAWAGMVAGLGEGVWEVARHWIRRAPHWAYGPEVLWMAPLTVAGIYTVVGGMLILLAIAWPRARSQAALVFVFTFLASVTLFRLGLGKLHLLAALLLATGLAVQAARWVRRLDLRRVVGRTAVWAGSLIVVIALLLQSGAWITERWAMARLPAPPANAPNVLLLVLDTIRAQNLGLYGYSRPTSPELDRFARRGVVFDRAIAPSPWTLPSHASLFTGHLPDQLSADWEVPLDATHPTLAEVLRLHGYATAGFIANLYYCSAQFGLSRGFIHYEDHPLSLDMMIQRSWLARSLVRRVRGYLGNHQLLARKSAEQLTNDFLAWHSRNTDRPFFGFLNYYDAHEPYLPPPPYRGRFGKDPSLYWLLQPGHRYTATELRELVDAYDSVIASLDAQLGRLFRALDARGLSDNTLIIITSDHGEEFGEHGLVDHGNSLYFPALSVPLIMIYPPSIPAGRRVADPVGLRDLPATIVTLTGIGADGVFPGQSLHQRWSAPDTHAVGPSSGVRSQVTAKPWTVPEWFPIHHGTMRSLVWQSWHYIQFGDGREELYDIAADPWEQADLRASEPGRTLVPSLRQALTEAMP